MQIRHILLTTDLSPESLGPCKDVADLARLSGARITLLHVVYELDLIELGVPVAPPLVPPDVGHEVAQAERVLEEQKHALGPGLEVATAVVRGDKVPDSVADYAREHGVDLIAVSTHGRSGFKRLALGSVTEELLRKSPVPVLVFPRAG